MFTSCGCPALITFMTMTLGHLILAGAYLFGCFVSYWMMKIEIEAEEGGVYTKGDKATGIALSVLSWLGVIMALSKSWVEKIGEKGYWKKPVKEQDDKPLDPK